MDVQIACVCPGTPHERDTVTLRDSLGFVAAAAVANQVKVARIEQGELLAGEVLALLTEGYLFMGIASWSLVDDKGKPVPVTKAEIRARLLSDFAAAHAVGEVADELYAEAVMLPLLQAASRSSPPTPTTDSTSAPIGSGRKPRKPSSRSSTASTPTVVTGTMSGPLVGVSSFSPSSESAA